MVSSLPQLLTSTTHRLGDHIALSYLDHALSYEELHTQSRCLAQCLRSLGVQRGDRVGIYLEKSIESVIAIYGILMAGAAYVPLDISAPPARLRHILFDCRIQIVITNETQRTPIRRLLQQPHPLTRLLGLARGDDFSLPLTSWQEIYHLSTEEELPISLAETDIAYILYTSGSTGEPKGIIHTHGSALSFIQWAAETFAIATTDRLSSHAQFHFDLSIFDLFVSAATGATVILIPENVALLPASLANFIEREHMTVWYSVPFALIQLMTRGNLEKRNVSSLRWVLFAGERFPAKHLIPLMASLPQAQFCNLYGPTETNVCTSYTIPASLEEQVALPIGYGCTNAELLILDAEGKPVPPGSSGELVVRGPSVMLGYWEKPDLNRKAFVSLAENEEPFYRTGDLVQGREDGRYELIGRRDRQIKLRGYRIELDEIETVLTSYPAVEEAAIYFEGTSERGSIQAVVLPKPACTIEQASLMKYLREQLPLYALPETVFIVQEFPRTSTGKIHRRHLPQWVQSVQAKME